MHKFALQKAEYWIKPGSKYFFFYLFTKVFTEDLGYCFLSNTFSPYLSKSNKGTIKMSKPLCKNLWNIDRNETKNFAVCMCYYSF